MDELAGWWDGSTLRIAVLDNCDYVLAYQTMFATTLLQSSLAGETAQRPTDFSSMKRLVDSVARRAIIPKKKPVQISYENYIIVEHNRLAPMFCKISRLKNVEFYKDFIHTRALMTFFHFKILKKRVKLSANKLIIDYSFF